MRLLTSELLQELMSVHKTPCLSLYQPTHRILPDNLQDPIRFKDLVKQLEQSLNRKYSGPEVKSLIHPFEELGNDNRFWPDVLEGIAVFGAPDYFEVISLQDFVPELAIVANSFHLKPLRQYLQTNDRFQILGLSYSDVRLFEGSRHSLVKIEFPEDFPDTIEKAVGEELTERHSTVKSLSGPGRANLQHGEGTRKDEIGKDAEHFFRTIDRLIHEKYSNKSQLPLILAALPEHHNLFHKVSRNPMLQEKGIMINPKSISMEKLRELAWEIIEPEYTTKLDWIIAQYEESKSHGLGSDNLNKIAIVASQGRVSTLMIESGRLIPGKISNEHVQKGDLNKPGVDDLLDDIGELVSSKGGTVMVIPKEKMPSQTGIAATFRW